MTQVIISNVDEHVVQGLKQIAWQRGLPFDESLRRLLSDAVDDYHGPGRRFKTNGTGPMDGIRGGIPAATD